MFTENKMKRMGRIKQLTIYHYDINETFKREQVNEEKCDKPKKEQETKQKSIRQCNICYCF